MREMGDKGQNNALRESFRSRYSHGRLKLSMEATVEKTEQVRRRRMPTEDWQKSEVGNVLWRVESPPLHIFENFNSLISKEVRANAACFVDGHFLVYRAVLGIFWPSLPIIVNNYA